MFACMRNKYFNCFPKLCCHRADQNISHRIVKSKNEKAYDNSLQKLVAVNDFCQISINILRMFAQLAYGIIVQHNSQM